MRKINDRNERWTRSWLDDNIPGLREVEEMWPSYHVVLHVAWWRLLWPGLEKQLEAFIETTKPAHLVVQVRRHWY